MQLITAKCPDCGANLNIPDGQLSVKCDYCGSLVLVSDILGSDAIMQNCMTLAYTAMKGESYQDAYDHFNKALEQNSRNFNAWYGKAICAGMTSTVKDVRLDEMLALFDNAFKYAPEEKIEALKKAAAVEIFNSVYRLKPKYDEASRLMSEVSGYSGDDSGVAGLVTGSLNSARDEINRGLDKAHEYDPQNMDINLLRRNFNTVLSFPPEQQASGFITPEPPGIMERTSPAGSGGSKAGCTIAIAAIVLVLGVAGVVFMLAFNSGPKMTKYDTPTKQSPTVPQVQEPKNTYSIVDVSKYRDFNYISLYTSATSDEDISSISKKVIEQYKSKKKSIVINFYNNKADANSSGSPQITHDDIWIEKNASKLGLKAVCVYDMDAETSVIYSFTDGQRVRIK